MWPSGFGADMTGPQYATAQIAYQYDDKVERLAIKKISGGGTIQVLCSGPAFPTSISRPSFCPRIPQRRAGHAAQRD